MGDRRSHAENHETTEMVDAPHVLLQLGRQDRRERSVALRVDVWLVAHRPVGVEVELEVERCAGLCDQSD